MYNILLSPTIGVTVMGIGIIFVMLSLNLVNGLLVVGEIIMGIGVLQLIISGVYPQHWIKNGGY